MPYNPLTQAELDQQRAEQNSAAPNASPEAQQAAAEHAVRQQQSYQSSPSHQASLAHAAQREAEKAQQTALEGHYRSQGIPTWTGADGNLYPDTKRLTDQAAKEQERVAKEQAAADKAAAALAAKQQRAAAIRSERKHRINPVDGTPIYLESEQDLAKRRDTEAEKTRQSQLDAQIKAVDAEHNDTFAKHAAEGVKPLTETARKKLAEKEIPQTKQDALAALQSHYQNLSAQKSGDADWIPFNESPTPEAAAAAEHLKRLQSPDADLTEEDLATLAGNDATKPLATRLQNQQQLLSKDDELQKLKADHALRVADLKLRRDAPDKWTESVRARRAAMSPEELKADLEASGADLDARAAALQQQATSLNEQVAQHTQQLDTLAQQAEQRRQQGIPAGDLVSYQGPDGTVEHWPKDLAAQREAIMARLQDTQSQQQSDWAALKAQEKELQHEASLHNEAAQLLQTTQKAKVEEAKKADLTHLQFTPGHEQTAQELAALDEESQSRLAALNEQYQGNPPPEALDALQKDIDQRSQAALGLGESRRLAGIAAADDLKRFSQYYDKDGFGYSQTEIDQRRAAIGKNLSQVLGITPEAADHLISDAQAQDWSPPQLPISKGLLADTVEGGAKWLVDSVESIYKPAKEEEKTRLLSTGGIAVNPSITKEQDYRKAVEDSKATPEAKAEALSRYPAVREQAGQKVLDGIHEIGSIYGPDTIADYTSTLKNKPKDVSEAEWAMRFTENLKAEARHGILNTLKSVGWEAWQSFNEGFIDQRAMASGLSAGALPNGLGSETMMKDAQWANRKAAALDTGLEIGGDQSTNPIAAGLFHQAPRFIGSLIGPGIAAKGAGGALSIFAKSKLGTKLLPSVAALLAKTAAPARAAASVDRITKAMKAGKLTVAEADAHVAKSLLSASNIAAPTAAQTVQAVKALTRAGIGGAAAAGAAQTYGAQITDIYTALKAQHPEMSHADALRAAQVPSLLSAGVTAMLTVLVPGGSDRFLARPAVAKELFKKQFASQLQRLGYMGKEFLKGGGQEFIEEAPDELFSQYQAGVASNPDDPSAGTKAVAAYFDNLATLAVGVGVLGGVPGSITAHGTSSIQRPAGPTQTALLPETQAAAEAAIQNHRHLDANNVEIPEFTQATQQRAALALATARGGDLFDATEKQLNAAGWTRRDSQGRDMPPGKFARLKDYTGPNVLNIDTNGAAHIDPAYLASLKDILPAVAAAIPDEATKPSPINEPTSTTDTSTAKSGNPAAGQTPADGPGPNANPSPVQAPAQSGAEPAPSGTVPPQSGTPVTSENSANSVNPVQNSGSDSSSSTTVPTVEKSIADWLVDRHMPDAEAAAAAKAITSHPDMAGKDYDHFTRQITARDALLQSLGITGSTSKKQAAANPLRFRSDVGTPARTSGSDSGPSETPPTKNEEPGTNNSPSLPPSVQAALDDSIPGTPSQEVFDAIKKAVQAKELTEQDATTLVAQQSGAQDHTELRQALENKLGWNTTRANTAAALHFGDKSKSDIPLAAAERDSASNRVPSGSAPSGNSDNSVNPVQTSGSVGPEPELASAPSALTQNDDYARAKLAALSRIKDPAKKSWARQLFALIEKTFEKHHLLYDALATGAVARKHLGGQFTAVMVIDGKVTRLIDLDAMVGQFSHIENPAAALRATGIEEDVHALVLQLSRKNPEKYGYPALVKKWKALPDKLKQTVWQSYNNAAQGEGLAKSLPIPDLSASQEWHMMNEFLRMLVQDKHFAGQITETVDAAPGLIQWLKDLLKDLGNILRNLLKEAPPALQKDIKSMVAEIGQRLKDIEKPSAATAGTRLETIPTLADTQGVTQQTLTSLLKDGQGILSPAALSRIWDQLDPALQKRVFAQKERTPRQTTLLKLPYTAATRAPKHELMQELLTLLLTDPAAAQSLLDTPKSTNLLAKLVSSLRSAIAPATAPSPEATTAALLGTLHAQTLRLLGSISGTRFVQSLPPAVAQAVTTAPPAVAAKIAASRIEPVPVSPAPVSTQSSVNPVQNSETPASAPEPIHPRAADFLAAIESAEKDHTDAANDEGQAKLRAKLRLQEVASIRAQFFLRDNAAREQHQATQAGRQDVEKATALQDLALGRIGARRPASAWRTLGLTERRRLALLGIGVDQHPHTETGGYPYSLSRIESAEARVEFSLAGTPENQLAQEELDWTRQQPAEYQTALDPLSPAYVERDHVIIKQSALDDLALSYPHTAALIRPEWHTRQSYGLRTDARSAQVKQALLPAPPEERQSNTQQPELPTSAQPPASGNPIPNSGSGSGIPLPLHSFAKNSGTEKPAKPVTFDVPVKGEGTITATFPDTASREAFQFKHDLARSRKLPSGSERTKLETSLSTLKARFMADLGLGDDAVTTKLAAYHEHVVAAAAEHAAKNRIGGITAPQFEAFSGGRSAPSTKSLPAPVGGDLIADLARYGIGRISSTVQPGKAGDMDWFKSVTDGTAGPHKQTALILAVKAADAGELTTPLARRIWLAGTAGLGLTPAQARWERPGHVLAPNGMPIDAAASTLSSQQADGSGTPYQFESGDALGLAILEALDSRIAAKGQSADPTLAAESDAQEQSRNFATLISGNQESGQSMTGAAIAAALDPDTAAENTLKLGTAWFTVDSQDDTGLHLTASGPDADLYGAQTLAPDQSYPVTQINDTPLGTPSASAASTLRSSTQESEGRAQSPESLEAQRSALPSDQRDIFQRRALETIHRELPPEQLATPQDIAELQRDYQESVAAGESLDESTPDLDLDDDIADSADAYLDGEPLPASRRTTPEQRTQELTGATAKVNGQTVQTGQPVTFRFLHNKESATKIYGKPKKDSHFDRGFEPSGRFVTEARSNAPYLLENFPQQYETGELTFENPIVIDWGSYGTDASWKRRLSTLYGNIRGKKLSQAILDDGFDGIITTDKDGHSSEILDLTTFDPTKALYAAPRELSHLSLSTGWLGYPQPRGELTKPKLIQYLKDAVNKPVSRKRLSQFVLSYNDAQDLLDHTYYHGTSNFISGTVKPSITLSDRQAEQMGGGGYGEKYWAVSLSKDKRTAESFSGQSRGVSIHPVLLKKAAKVITLPDVQDAADLEDHILDLWKNQVDAVWIGGGEQELAVINPKAIVFAADSDYYAVFGGYKSENFTLEKAEAVRAQAQSIVDTYDLDTHPKLLFAAKRTPDSTLPQPRLTALHNLSYENLVFADRLGGLAAPSIAVTPKGQGMSGFGQITLIGTRDLVDPSKEPVFDADAYSPRFPDAEYSKAKSKDAQKIVDAIRPFAKSFDDRSLTDTIWDNAVNRPRPADTVEKMLRSDAAKAAFLATQGIQVQPVMKPTSITHEVVHEPAFAPFRADPQSWLQTDYHDPAAMQRLGQIVKEAIQQNRDKSDLEPELKAYLEKTSEARYLDNGAVPFGIFDRIGRDLKNLGTETLDHEATRKTIAEALTGKEAEFKQWAENLILPLHPAPQLTLKGRKVPYTLATITAAMTGRVRGREDTMAFGEGAARAHISKKFTDLEQMRKAATTQILPEDQVSAARDRAQKLLATYREQVAEYTTLTNWRGNPDHFAAFDAAMRALVTWAKGRKDTAALANGLRREGFKDVPAKVLNLGQQAAEAWLNAPVPYFEAKPQRAVSLREFAGAVIPDSAPSGIAKILDKYGIQHRTYTGDTTAQAQAAAQFAQDLNSEDSPTLFAALRTRHDATFSPAIQTPLGSLERYTWQHKLDDVWDNRAGEYQTKRVSDWDKAITNAETGRDIVHHFDVRKPDGTVQTVSLESALGSLAPEQKKSTATVIKALRRLPMNEALLQDIEAKRTAYLDAWKQAEQEGWKAAPDIQLQDHSFPARAAEGLKEGTIDGQWVGNYEPNELPLSAQAIRQAKTRWATAKVEPLKLSYQESNKLDSLPRIIKKDRQTLKDAGVTTNSEALPAAPRTVEHVEPGFYSALAEAIRAKMPARSTPSTVVGILKNAGIKTEELKWTGILPWLQQQAQNGPITQQQVLDYLANEGAVHLQEVRLGGSQTNLEDANRAVIAQAQSEGMTKAGAEDYALSAARGDLSPGQLSLISPTMRPLVARLRASYEARASEYAAGQSQPKYSQYQLPGGTNYREVVLTMPGKEDRSKIPEGYQLVEGTGLKKWEVYGPGTGRYAAGQTPSEAIENFWDLHGKHHDIHAYTSSHFQYIPNYVAHMRLNDRTDTEGKDGTFIEEIQSDRHQAGREKGYQISPEKIQRHKELREKWLTNSLTEQEGAEFDSLGDQYNQSAAVPDAPFRTSWPLQMFKRALVDAVASGKQWIGWTTGGTQAERYKLSKQVDGIQWEQKQPGKMNGVPQPMAKVVTINIKQEDNLQIAVNGEGIVVAVLSTRMPELKGKPLGDVIGKEMAKRILETEAGDLSGDGLNIGGEGMKGFYDTILPKEIGKYVKQWGEAVKEGSVQSVVKSATPSSMDALLDELDDNGNIKPESYPPLKQTPIWRIDITPQMKAGVEAGQALFAAPRRAYESMTFDPPFHTRFGDILSYDWMNQPVGGLSSQRTSDWSRARTNPATGRDIVHHFKVQKPDGIHTVSLETALGQLTEPQRHKLQSLIKSEQRRREEAAAGQMTLFAAQRFDLSRALAPTTTQSGALTSLFNPRPGAPQNADPRRGYFPSTATPQLITQAYTAAAVGQSSAMLPIRRVFEQAQSLQPSLTPAAFLQAVKSADDSGQVLLEPYDTPAALEAAQPFVLRNASGIPCVSMAVTAALPAAQRVEAAAAETDPNPSAAQKAAGNYPKGKVTLHGLRLSIENPRGSTRSGTDATGKPWSVTMPHHYGYFLGTEGKDGDHVDFFLGPNPDSQQVLIINQRKPSNGHFDEHKIMIGFNSPAEAARGYMASYTPGWKGLQSAIPTTIPVLKEWLQNHDTTKPVTREGIAKIAQSLPSGSDSDIPLRLHSLAENSGNESPLLPASPRVEQAAKALDKTVTGLGQAANLIPKAVGKTLAAVTGTGQYIPGNQALATLGTALGRADAAAAAKVGTTVADALQRVSGKDIRKAPDAVAAWLGKPDGLGAWTKSVVVDQLLPTALMPREWLALSHEMQRKTAFGAEKSNDLIRALSGNPRLSDLAYPKEFAENMMYREQLFDAMEGKIPMSSLPPAMQALGTKLRAMLRDTGLELVKQGVMHPDTFEELQSNGWMPRYMLEEAMESGGSVLAAFKLGVKDLMQQRSTAFHIVDTTRKGKDGQYLTVNRKEGGRNAWRFRDAATRDAFYSDFIRRQALDMLQDTHGNTKELQTMMATLDGQQRREIRAQIKLLTRADMDSTQKLSPALAGMVKQAIEHQKSIYRKEAPFDPPKLIKDPVYSIARYILAQTHNAATMELLNETAKNKDWTSNVSLQGFTEIPDNDRFGPLAGKFVQKDIAQQILDKLDVPNAALRFYDAVLRKWKSGKLVWNPGSHIRDAVGNTVFAYLGGSNIANPGNWPYYRQAMEIMRNGGPLYNELLEHGVLGGDAYSSLVRERLKGLLPDAKTVENFNPGLIQRFFLDFGSKFHGTHEQLAEYRRMPDDFYKIAAYLKAKHDLQGAGVANSRLAPEAAAHVRKWFPYYDRLGGSATTRAAGRFVNPFLSFFRESTRILGTAAVERPIALAAALAFPAAISALSAMLLGLDDRDRDEISKDLAGRGKGILGLSSLHLFSMLLPVRSSQGQVQQFDISAIMPFADLLGQKIVPLEEKENAWQTFWRQTAAAGPIGNLGVSWITNRDLFSGRHLTEADMSTPEMLRAYTQHAAGVALPPLAPDLAALVGIGDGGALSRAGTRQTNKTLQTYDTTQTVIRSIFGMNVKSAAPNIYRQADDFRKTHGYDAQPDFDYGTTATSRAKRALVQQLAQDQPNPTAIKNLVKRLKDMGVPLDTPGAITKVLKIIDPASIIGGSRKQNLTAEDARQRFRQSLPPESRALYEASLQEYRKIQQRAPLLLRAAQ